MGNSKRIVIAISIPIVVVAAVTVLSLMPPSAFQHAGGWFSRIPYIDKAVHFCFYFCAVTAARFAMTHAGKYDARRAWLLLILAAAYGGAMELLQGRWFDRGCDIFDEAANVLGAAAALSLVPQSWHAALDRGFKKLF